MSLVTWKVLLKFVVSVSAERELHRIYAVLSSNHNVHGFFLLAFALVGALSACLLSCQ